MACTVLCGPIASGICRCHGGSLERIFIAIQGILQNGRSIAALQGCSQHLFVLQAIRISLLTN